MQKYLSFVYTLLGVLILCGAAPTERELQLQQARTEFYNYAITEFVPVESYTLGQYIGHGHSLQNHPDYRKISNDVPYEPIVGNLTLLINAMERVKSAGYTPMEFVAESMKAVEGITKFIGYYTSPKNFDQFNAAQKQFAEFLIHHEYLFRAVFMEGMDKMMGEFQDKCMPRFHNFVNMLNESERGLLYPLDYAYYGMLKRQVKPDIQTYFIYQQMFTTFLGNTEHQ